MHGCLYSKPPTPPHHSIHKLHLFMAVGLGRIRSSIGSTSLPVSEEAGSDSVMRPLTSRGFVPAVGGALPSGCAFQNSWHVESERRRGWPRDWLVCKGAGYSRRQLLPTGLALLLSRGHGCEGQNLWLGDGLMPEAGQAGPQGGCLRGWASWAQGGCFAWHRGCQTGVASGVVVVVASLRSSSLDMGSGISG